MKGIHKDRELPRTKRLLRVEDDNGETTASCLGKASKCLQFPIKTTWISSDTTTNSTAINKQERYFTRALLPIGVSLIGGNRYGLVLQAFPCQLTALRPLRESPLPIRTSTTIASKTASNHRKEH